MDIAVGTIRPEPGTTKNDDGRTFPFAALPALADLLTRQRERTVCLAAFNILGPQVIRGLPHRLAR